jgi:cytochrome c biogenesis protein CcmG/thiol:disulfide interchange protein DsbE
MQALEEDSDTPERPSNGGRFFTPSTAFLVGSLALLAVVLVLIAPSLFERQTPANTASVADLSTAPRVGALAPDFQLKDAATGQMVSLKQFAGKPVWLNFWASWCEGCREEMPLIERSRARYGSSGLAVLGINVQESADEVNKFVRDNGFGWTFLLDSDGRVTDLYYVNGIPFHVFISADGVIRAIHPGVVTEQNIESYLRLIRF